MHFISFSSKRYFVLYYVLSILDFFSLYPNFIIVYICRYDRQICKSQPYKYIHFFRHLCSNNTHYFVLPFCMHEKTNDPSGNTAHYLCSTTAFITSVSLRALAHSAAAPTKILSFHVQTHIAFSSFSS